jgi:phosphatidylserine decarboxylase
MQERPVVLNRGDPVGEFNLGSSIVLVFEAPEDFSFGLAPGGRVLFGKALGRVGEAIQQ